jgi:hypothetical protein
MEQFLAAQTQLLTNMVNTITNIRPRSTKLHHHHRRQLETGIGNS